eukprot:11179865-Lingulodinium_polyedra.AAC.1
MERYRAKLRRLGEPRQKGSPPAGLPSELSRDPEPIVKMWHVLEKWGWVSIAKRAPVVVGWQFG